ncbi:MAG: ABC transporter ATP-binding protein/permease, partial [Acidimicrobiia bacterium]|nr:ABC transporter ATP-binding protein/permease [Acidimicrobiia bacterium]
GEFDAVTFAYQDGDEEIGEVVLDEVSFRVAPGRVVGVLGRTGSGKSTLARLLTRLYDPIHGRVLLGGVAARVAKTDDLRRRVGMVTQDVQLFRASVRDNLTFFDPDASNEAIMEVLVDLGLADWVSSLPDGLDTQLESGSGGLSAGEAQLLAFTRIFLKDPGLVILDEASSRLDPATEQLIERAVDKLLTNRTGIIIAHRLATVTRADDVLILDEGRVVEFGERVALAADPGSRFSRFLLVGLEEMLA